MTPQTATVSDEAVQAAIKASPYVVKNDTMQWMRRALTAALPHLALSAAPCSGEAKDILATLDECWEYFDNKADVKDDADGPISNDELHLLTQVKEAHKALSSILSQIVTKPVDVAAVRKQAFEEAAQVAEIRHEKWSNGDGFHDSEGLPAVSCDVTACENIAAAIRTLSPAEPVAPWQLIETAPAVGGKPYGEMLLCAHDTHKWVRFGRYDPVGKRWLYSGTSERSQWAMVSGDEPTHWMPLPAAPTSKGGE